MTEPFAAPRRLTIEQDVAIGHLSNALDSIAPFLAKGDLLSIRRTSTKWYTKSLEMSVTQFLPLGFDEEEIAAPAISHFEGVTAHWKVPRWTKEINLEGHQIHTLNLKGQLGRTSINLGDSVKKLALSQWDLMKSSVELPFLTSLQLTMCILPPYPLCGMNLINTTELVLENISTEHKLCLKILNSLKHLRMEHVVCEGFISSPDMRLNTLKLDHVQSSSSPHAPPVFDFLQPSLSSIELSNLHLNEPLELTKLKKGTQVQIFRVKVPDFIGGEDLKMHCIALEVKGKLHDQAGNPPALTN